MGWIGWGLFAARRIARGRRRQPFFYTNLATELVAYYLDRKQREKQAREQPKQSPTPRTLGEVPNGFEQAASWDWAAEDIEYYRYATERWKVYTCEKWGVLELPAGKSAACNFFGIVQLREDDERGAVARGVSGRRDLDGSLPVLVLFRLADGYNEGFAAVQSWADISVLVEQDRIIERDGRFPRPELPSSAA